MNSIITKVRNLIGDGAEYTSNIFSYDGLSRVFTLTEAHIDPNSLVCYKNGALWVGSGLYSYSNLTGKITVAGTLVVGDNLEFDYNAHIRYSDNEIRRYIGAALSYIATEKYEVFVAKCDNVVFPTPTEAEESMIALIASILMKGNLRDYNTPEIKITFNEKETTEEKITRVIRQFRKTFGTIRFIKTDRDIKIDKEDE